MAAERGLSAIALTDHDNFDGIGEARDAAERTGVEFVPGTELSVEWDTGAMHLLVYFVDGGTGPLQDAMVAIRAGRADRNRRLADRLQTLGLDVTWDEVADQAGGAVVGRPHFAAVMVRKGYVDDIATAFDRYLAAGRPAYVPRVRLGAIQAIDLARASGGVPVIAHPHTIGAGAEDYQRAFGELADAGLGGIECHYVDYAPALRSHLAGVAADLGLVATGGSDYHGAYKPGIEVGTGRGDLVVPDGVLAELVAAR